MDNRILRALILDQSADDAEQLINVLRTGPYILKAQLAPNANQAQAMLVEGQWDLLLVEPATPGVHLNQLVTAARAQSVPVLAVMRKTNAPDMQKHMSDGVRDAFIKGEWSRLLPAVARELEAVAQRQELEALKERLTQVETRYRAMIENSQEAVCYCHEGVYVDANDSYMGLLGYTDLDELKGVPLLDMIDKADRARFKTLLQKGGGGEPVEFNAVRRDGQHAPVEITVSRVEVAGEPCLQISLKDIAKRKALEQKLETLNQRDALTGLASKRKFALEVNECLKKFNTAGGSCTLLTLELLRLRELNDKLGHAAADRMLLTLAQQLKKQADAGHLLGRLGGGQFAVLLRGTPREQADRLCTAYETIANTFRFTHQGQALEFEFAFGVAQVDASVKDSQKFLNDCYKVALDRARQPASAPAATLAVVEPTPPPAVTKPRAAELAIVEPPKQAVELTISTPVIEPAPVANMPSVEMPAPVPVAAGAATAPVSQGAKAEIENALIGERFQLRFQPIINLHGEMRELFEAVVMMENSQGELLDASAFMPDADAHGLATKIDRWVAMRAVETLIELIKKRKPAALLVPLSAAAVADNLLLAAMQQHLKATAIPADRLFVQVEAAALARDPRAAMVFAQIVKRMGAGLVINDDSADLLDPKLLHMLPLDYYKVPANQLANLKAAVTAAHAAEKSVIATGVEDGELFAALFSESVDYVQGNYLSAPMPDADYPFAGEQELSSDSMAAPSWNVGG